MDELLPFLLVVVVAIVPAIAQWRSFPRSEATLLAVAFVGHIAASVAQVVITEYVYGYGDMDTYFFWGGRIVRMLEFGAGYEQLVRLFFHAENYFPVEVLGAGNATGTMCAITGFLCLVLGYHMYAVTLVIGLAAYFGKVALYRVLRAAFPPAFHKRLLFSALILPSVTLWSCGILKESVAIGFVGWAVLGVHYLMSKRFFTGGVLVMLGVLMIGLLKSYLLFPLAIASGAWWLTTTTSSIRTRLDFMNKPIFVVGAIAFVVVAIAVLGRQFPEYSVENLNDRVVSSQDLGRQVAESGDYSSYSVGASPSGGLAGQLLFAPLGLATALFRPMLFEARNLFSATAALENTIFLVLFYRSARRRSWRVLWQVIKAQPLLLFSVIFVVLFGTAVGITSTNFGTLSRYRMPLMPFYAALVLVLDSPHFQLLRAGGAKPSPAPARPARGLRAVAR